MARLTSNRSLVLGPGARWIWSGSNDHTVRVWRLAGGPAVSVLTLDGPVVHLVGDASGRRGPVS